MKLALRRSVTFWSGIVMMTFTGWAWWDSLQNRTLAYWPLIWSESYAGGCFLFKQTDPGRLGQAGLFGQLTLPVANEYLVQPLPPVRLFRGLGGRSDSPLWGVDPPSGDITYLDNREFLMSTYPTDYRELFIPYWLILLGIATSWTTLLLWRARRRRKVHPKETTPAA